MDIIDVKYQPMVVKTNGKNPIEIAGQIFYPDTAIPYKNGYILPILKQTKNVGNIFQDIGSYVSDAGKWVSGAVSDVSSFIKDSGAVDIIKDVGSVAVSVNGLINQWNDLTGQNKKSSDYSQADLQTMQQILNNKTNTTGQLSTQDAQQLANILGSSSTDKYLPYIAIGGGFLFILLLILILKK